MANFYNLLGIDESANQTEIRAAYKRQAMQYHPDRNAGDKEAEEMFKNINEAYHVLSDPIKKARYDARLNSALHSFEEEYWREMRRVKFWQWQQAQQSGYRIDKNYFKIQGLAFLVFIIMAGFCFGIIHTINYFIEQKQVRHWNENGELLKQANTLFLQKHFDEAFGVINSTREKDPFDFRFRVAHDSLVNELRALAKQQYGRRNFKEASYYYEILKHHELPIRSETLEHIATCQYHLGLFDESILSMKHLHNQQPWNLQLIYWIGLTNLDKLDNKKEALHYFTLGKKLFKKNLSSRYGAAFEVVMNPDDVPEIYYEIFVARARTNLALKNYEEALKDGNWIVYLRRSNSESFALRAKIKAESGKLTEICPDIYEAQRLGADVTSLQIKYCR
jgi:hypothetical protein